MASMVANFVGKKIMKESLENNFGKEDPYFETVPATRLDGNGKPSNKKPKKTRKAMPPGLSAHDVKVLTKAKRRAYRLDQSMSICGMKFGLSSVIGIIPVAGDILDVFLALMVFQTCRKVEGGLPQAVQMQMIMNIALDFAVGLVPFLGDVADAVFKANTRNAVVLEKFLRKKGQANLKAQGRSSPQFDPSDEAEFDAHMADDAPPPTYSKSGRQNTQGQNGNGRDAPRQQQAPAQQQSGGGFFGFGNKQQTSDPERGQQRGQDPSRQKSTLQKNRS